MTLCIIPLLSNLKMGKSHVKISLSYIVMEIEIIILLTDCFMWQGYNALTSVIANGVQYIHIIACEAIIFVLINLFYCVWIWRARLITG